MSIKIHPVNAETERACLMGVLTDLRVKNPDKNILVIVPESMTLEYEQDILKNREGMVRIAVKSMKKLENSVLETYGYGPKYKNEDPKIISKSGMIARIYVLMKELLDKLEFCKNPRISSAEKVFDTLHELEEHQVKLEDLENLIEKDDISPILRSKLHDLALFMKAIATDIGEDGMGEYEKFNAFINQAILYKAFANTDIVFIGYDIIYRRINNFIGALFEQDFDGSVHFVCMKPENDQQIYSELDRSIQMLRDCLKDKKEHVNSRIPEVTIDDSEYASLEKYDPAIKYLAMTAIGKKLTDPENMDSITIYNSPNQYTECLHAAQQLIDWHNEGCDWRNMGIVADVNSKDTIISLLPLVLESAGIPYFMSTSRSSLLCSDVYYLAKLVSAAARYDQQDIIDIMKSGYSPLDKDESHCLEVYAHEHGITGSKWKKPFTSVLPDPKIDALNELRERLINPIIHLHDDLANKKYAAEDQARAIWNYLNDTGFYQKLQSKEQEYRSAGYAHYADQVRQSWHIVCKALNIVATETTDHHLSLEMLDEIITKILHSENLKSIPQTADAVLVDDARVFVPGMRKNCVILSMQERMVEPSVTLLTNADKKWIEENSGQNHYLIYTVDEKVLCRRIMQSQYRSFMSATDRLCLSASTLSHNGALLIQDDLYKRIAEIVKNTNPENIKGGVLINDIRPYGRDVTVELLAQKLRELVFTGTGDLSADATGEYAEQWKKAYAYFADHEPETIREILKSMNSVPFAEDINPEAARQLFAADITSVSELETFAECPFRHFIEYGIKPREVRDYSFENDERGTFYHAAMKAYIERGMQDKKFPNIDQQKIIEYFNEAVRPLLDDLKSGVLAETAFNRLVLAGYVQTVRTSALYVTYWLAESKYKPYGCEISFGRKDSTVPALVLNLPDGRRVVLSGSIDRMDVYTDDAGNTFGRIVDYKSSAKTLDREAVENGFTLQLPLYLEAIAEGMPDLHPSGALYQHLSNIVVNTDSVDEEEVRKKILDSTQLNGMYLVSDDESLEKANGGSVKKSKSQKNIFGVSETEMKSVLENSRCKAIEHAVNIGNGKISINPKSYTDKLPCEFCKCQNICMIRNRKKVRNSEEEE